MRIYLILYGVLICVVCGACKNNTHDEHQDHVEKTVEPGTLLKPANGFVLSSVPVTTMEEKEQDVELSVVGRVTYDTRQTASISSRVSGRIEKLYIHYRYQEIAKGQRIMDIYSKELVTAQQNLLFVLKNDTGNNTLINAAKERLLLLGMTAKQVDDLVNTQVVLYAVPVFSKYGGFITDGFNEGNMQRAGEMDNQRPGTEQLSVREGMYVTSGQRIFSVYDARKAWILLDVYPGQETLLHVGDAVRVVPETAPAESFRAKIDYIEPVFRNGKKTLNARIYLNNASMKLPLGTRVTATVFSKAIKGWWLPAEAVVSLGRDRIAFKKVQGGFRPQKIAEGIMVNRSLQVLEGLSNTDSVAANAQYLIDNEAFIKVDNR
jgi:membrane fusion protein, copper/silver efflux system